VPELITLVLGGTRSGKSAHAERLVQAAAAPWTYVATGVAGDADMSDRIRRHQDRRGAGWATVEEPIALAEVLLDANVATQPVLVDCLTLWTSNLMHAGLDVAAACDTLEVALSARRAPVVLVASEVGLGIVPDNALARHFRDEAGRVNQRIAAVADHVHFVVAGLPMIVK
jgi:adenosylcobinamide kinase/adenosylcobinamide-phosphate guanylyltransferase